MSNLQMMSTFTTTTSVSAKTSEQCIQVIGGGSDHRATQGAAAASAAPAAPAGPNGTEAEGIDGEMEFFATDGSGDNERQTTLVIRNSKSRSESLSQSSKHDDMTFSPRYVRRKRVLEGNIASHS